MRGMFQVLVEQRGVAKTSAALMIRSCLLIVFLLLSFQPLSALAYDPCGSEPPTALELQSQPAPLALSTTPLLKDGSSSSSVVRRLWGDTRYDTMRVVATTGFTRASTVVLACGDNYPDALAAASIAGINDSPVLLTGKDALPTQTADAIKLLGANKAILLGGEAAVSSNVANSLAGMGLEVSRIQGQTREQTAALIAEDVVSQSSPDTIIIANGYVPWDSLSVSPYAYSNGFPVLLTGANGLLSEDVLRSIRAMPGLRKAIVVGGPNAVNEGISAQLGDLQVQRWWGQTRYETSHAIAACSISSGSSASVVGIASGENFPDALTGGALIVNCLPFLMSKKWEAVQEGSGGAFDSVPDSDGLNTDPVDGGSLSKLSGSQSSEVFSISSNERTWGISGAWASDGCRELRRLLSGVRCA